MIATPKESKPINNQILTEDFCVQTDLHGVIFSANKSFLQILGLPLKKIRLRPLVAFLSPKDFVFPSSGFDTLFINTTSFEFESTFSGNKNGPVCTRWRVMKVPVPENENIVLQWSGVQMSAAPSTNNTHNEALDVYRSLFENCPQPMWIYNRDTSKMLDVNKSAIECFGFSKEEFLRITSDDLFPTKHKEQMPDEVSDFRYPVTTDKTIRIHQKKDKALLFAEIQTYNFKYDNQDAQLVIINDVTRKINTHKILLESEERFRNMADSAPVMIWLSDENDKTTYINKYWTDFTGINPSEAMGDGWSKVIHPDDRHIGVDEYKKGFEQKKPVSLVYRLKHRTGQYHWVLDNAVPRFLDNGQFIGFIGSVVDIHDRKLSEEKIRFQADLIENVSDIIISTDSSFKVVTWNKVAEKIYGLKAQQTINKHIRDIEWHAFVNTTQEEVFATLKEKQTWTGEVVFRGKNSEPVYLLSTASVLTDETNAVTGYVFVNRDITGKKMAEQSLKKSELFYRSLIGDSLDGIALTDASGVIRFVAPSVTNILGYQPEELVQSNIFSLVHPDDLAIAKEAFLDEIIKKAKHQYITVRVKNNNHEWIWCEVRGHNLLHNEEVKSIVVYFSDVSRRKEIENALKEGEQKFRLLSENSKDIICLHEINGNYLYVSPSITNVSGYLPEELVGKSPFDYFHPDESDVHNTQRKEKSLRKFIIGNMQYRFRKKDGAYIWLETTTQPIFGTNKKIVSLQTTSRDISDRMMVLQELKKKELEFRNLAENAPTIIQRLDKNLRYTYCNPAYTKILGIPSESIIGKTPGEAGVTAEALQKITKAARKVFKNKTIETIKINLTAKNGNNWSFIVTIAPELDEIGEVSSLLAISSNITEMRQTQELLLSKEEELIQSHERFELATKASTDSIWEVNMATGYVYLSAEFTRRFGYTTEELSGKDHQWYIKRLHPEDRLSVISKTIHSFSSREKLWRDEFRVRCKDGSYKYIYNRAYVFYDENGEPYKAIGAIQDITDRKKAESQLIQKDILLAASAQAANELLTEASMEVALNRSLRIVGSAIKVDRAHILRYLYNTEKNEYYFQRQQEWNSEEYESQLNNRESEYLEERSYPELFTHIKEGLPNELLLKDIKSPSLKNNFQQQHIKSLLLMPIFVQNSFWGVVGFDQCGYERGWTGMEMDILRVFASNLAGVFERKEGERKLLESEVKFKSLFQNSLDVVYVLDKQGTIKYVTPSVELVFGCKEEEVTGRNGLNFIHKEDFGRAKKLFEDLINNPDLNVVSDIRVKDKKGKWVWVEAKGVNKFNDVIINGAIVNFHDISDRKQSEQQLQGYSQHITNILNSITDGFIALDKKFNILWWNPIAEQLTGIKDVDVLGKNIWKALPGLKKTAALAHYKQTIESKTAFAFELYIGKLKTYFDVNAYPSQQGLFVYFKDITHRKKQEMLLSLEKDVLELNTNPSASLKNTIDFFLEGMETFNPGIRCSVLLLDDSGTKLRHLSAPSLPFEYISAIDGMKIGPKNGSCGTAVYLHKTIIVSDILNDPLWEDYKPFITAYPFKSCWSFPIVSSSNKVLGSFTVYYTINQSPTEELTNFFNRVTALMGVIIENKQAEQKVSISNERYLLATKATNDAIWDYDINTKEIYWGEGFYSLFGYKPDDHANQRDFWERKIHPDERKQIKELFDNAITNKERGVVNAEYRFQRADGKYSLVADRAFIVYDNGGEPARFVGSMQDITERRKLEQRLLKQEINKEKSIAQAVVDAQEKERAEIGKELHDNVNQILSTAKLYLELAKTDIKQKDELIKRSADSIFNAINEIRHISKALVPASVKDLGLIDSIKDLVESLRMTKALQVKFIHAGDFDNIISEKQKLMLFRIIQEQVSNVLKHAEAAQIIINLKLTDKNISLSIEDNGKGFDLEKIKFKRGVGLSNIESRAHLFNGKVTITTQPKKGCKLFIEIPIHNI